MDKNQPNIFEHATKELSQDALLAWLLAWADERALGDEHLSKCAKSLICAFLAKHGVLLQNSDIKNVRTKTQVRRVDVECIVNNKYHIVIEDKLSGSDSTEKLKTTLKKYRDNIKSAPDKLYPIYFKTHNENDTDYVTEAGFKVFDRKEFLSILNTRKNSIDNCIYKDYLAHLRAINVEYESYKTKKMKDWNPTDPTKRAGRAWTGFYSELQERLKDGRWGYSPNPQGGHYVFYWGFKDIRAGKIFCQIDSTHMNVKSAPERENIHLQVRVGVEDTDEHRSEFRNNCYTIAKEIYGEKAKKSSLYQVEKPARFQSGQTMRILCALGDIFVFDDSGIDMDKTTENLKAFASVLCDVQKGLQ